MLSGLDLGRWGGRLRVGTCSWKYESWKGIVYDEEKQYGAYDYLGDYARVFNTVEVDQWFWSLFATGAKLPNVDTVRRYAESVPEGFTFSVKAPNSITLTHHYAKQAKGSRHLANQPNPHFLDVGLLERFLETLGPMGGKLGPIILQFEYLNKQKMASREAFIAKLGAFFDKAPAGFVYAVECRNPKWLTDDFAAFLRGAGVVMVLLEGYYMRPVWEVAERVDVQTGSVSIVRLHGPDRAKIEEQTGGVWDAIAAPKDEGLAKVAEMVRASLAVDSDVYVSVNNHYEGCAPLTIQRLLARLSIADSV